ncbi:MAG TPA: hypothetical protein PKW76_08905 [bacterium]|jgi:YbbR domain-containing protein|nr:hypothetical protein [bacterium]HPG45787.1 hypothetical protein [bacterium]HPM97986.1 hypothetical protein [bacterium]
MMHGLSVSPKSNNRQGFSKAYKTKIASVLIAMFVWFLVVSGGTFDYVTTIPISATMQNDRYIVTGEVPQEAQIRLRGQGKALLAFLLFREGKLHADFNLESGQSTVRLSKENIVLTGNAKNLTVLELIHPKSFSLFIEEKAAKKVRIKPAFTITTLPGYTLVGDIVLEPAEVQVNGPRSMVDSLRFVLTTTATWDKQKYPLQKRIELVPPISDKLSLQTQRVTVSADIQKLMEKKIVRIPVRVINLPPNTTALVIPSTVSLVAEGGVEVLAQLTDKDIQATIDYRRQFDTSGKDFAVQIAPMQKVRFRNIEPQRFKIVLERK